ncbi:hypothetical protein ASE93_23495 [Serratia sp. Leaf50]|nr:hypothetical protein ASE93_23495 [Serratia sp. Leaf50]
MANTKFFTQDQIDNAKLALLDLPDLTPNRITREEMLTSLSDDIVTLSTKKGYSAADIKKALEGLDIQVSEKAIAEILKKSAGKSTRSRKPSRSTTNSNAGMQPSQDTQAS